MTIGRARRVRAVTAALAAVTAALAGCGGGAPAGPNHAAYLTIVKGPISGSLAQQPDAVLLSLGDRACSDLDRGMASDAIVTDLGGTTDPLPGSGDFNGYSVVVAAAARELCPAHRTQLDGGGSIPLDP